MSITYLSLSFCIVKRDPPDFMFKDYHIVSKQYYMNGLSYNSLSMPIDNVRLWVCHFHHIIIKFRHWLKRVVKLAVVMVSTYLVLVSEMAKCLVNQTLMMKMKVCHDQSMIYVIKLMTSFCCRRSI